MDVSEARVRPERYTAPPRRTARSVLSRVDVYSPALHSRIRRAQAQAGRNAELSRLPDGPLLASALLYLTDLATRAVRPFPRQMLANVLEVSTRSVDRRLADLEKLGWIERLPQAYDPDSGQWSITRVRWLPSAVATLFPAARRPAPAPDRATNLADLSVEVPSTQLPSKEKPLRRPRPEANEPRSTSALPETLRDDTTSLADEPCSRESSPAPTAPPALPGPISPPTPTSSTPCSDSSAATPELARPTRPQPGIPPALRAPAAEFDLSRVQLAVLMRECRARKQWLQDVLSLAEPHLRRLQLRSRAAVGYLLTMLSSDRDFSRQLRQRELDRRERYRAARRLRLLARISASIPIGTVLPWGRLVDRSPGWLILRDEAQGASLSLPDRAALPWYARLGWAAVRRMLRGRPIHVPTAHANAPRAAVFRPQAEHGQVSEEGALRPRVPESFLQAKAALQRARSLQALHGPYGSPRTC